jgi:hypothetical protein
LKALLELGKANGCPPNETKWRRADFREEESVVCIPGLIFVDGSTDEFPSGEKSR